MTSALANPLTYPLPRYRVPLLERRSQTKGPQPLHPAPLLGDGVVHPGHREAEQVGPHRKADGLRRGAHPSGIVPALAVPSDGALVVPCQADIVEDGPLNWREAVGKKAELRSQYRKPQLGTLP